MAKKTIKKKPLRALRIKNFGGFFRESIPSTNTITILGFGSISRRVDIVFADGEIRIDAGCFRGSPKRLREMAVQSYSKEGMRGSRPMYQRYKAEYIALADFAEKLKKIWYAKLRKGEKRK